MWAGCSRRTCNALDTLGTLQTGWARISGCTSRTGSSGRTLQTLQTHGARQARRTGWASFTRRSTRAHCGIAAGHQVILRIREDFFVAANFFPGAVVAICWDVLQQLERAVVPRIVGFSDDPNAVDREAGRCRLLERHTNHEFCAVDWVVDLEQRGVQACDIAQVTDLTR